MVKYIIELYKPKIIVRNFIKNTVIEQKTVKPTKRVLLRTNDALAMEIISITTSSSFILCRSKIVIINRVTKAIKAPTNAN